MATARRRPDVMAYRTVGTMPHTTKETKQATPRERGDASLAFCNCSPLAEAEELSADELRRHADAAAYNYN